MNLVWVYISTLFIIFVIPFPVYGLFVYFFKLKEPVKKGKFFFGVLLEKVGTAVCFVTLFFLGKEIFADKWLMYSAAWFLMFAFNEIGQMFMSSYSKKEAIAGIISEAIYFPLSAFIARALLSSF